MMQITVPNPDSNQVGIVTSRYFQMHQSNSSFSSLPYENVDVVFREEPTGEIKVVVEPN
jgi:hypothetical protein